MEAVQHESQSRKITPQQRYAKCIEVSRRIRWDIDRDVLRGRHFDPAHKFMPDGLSEVHRLPFLDARERRLMSQVQGRTYANMFGMIERFVGAKMLEVGRDHALGDQTALEAIVRFTDEELKHQELFRRVEALAAQTLPPGYRFIAQADEVAAFVLGKSTWSILALTCCVEIVTQVHYRQSMESDASLSPLFKDIFLFHWKEESQHAIIDELEWMREDARLEDDARDAAIGDLIELVAAIDGMMQAQAAADAHYFVSQRCVSVAVHHLGRGRSTARFPPTKRRACMRDWSHPDEPHQRGAGRTHGRCARADPTPRARKRTRYARVTRDACRMKREKAGCSRPAFSFLESYP